MTEARRAFGERLRRQRERRHVTLESIAETTKVAASLFAALERGDCRRWPAGVYRRAFIRGYADAIGLDADRISAEFAELHDDPSGIEPAAVADAPLRLTLEADPAGLMAILARRIATLALEVTALTGGAWAVAAIAGFPFWTMLGTATLGWHVTHRLTREARDAGFNVDEWLRSGRGKKGRQATAEPRAEIGQRPADEWQPAYGGSPIESEPVGS
jgi:transcriptional regulator with XRE-family HTH domain